MLLPKLFVFQTAIRVGSCSINYQLINYNQLNITMYYQSYAKFFDVLYHIRGSRWSPGDDWHGWNSLVPFTSIRF